MISRRILLRMRILETKCVQKIETDIFRFINRFSENLAVYEIIWKKYGASSQATENNIIWRLRFACWITEATDRHLEWVIRIVFTWQQWVCERASMLRRTYITCIVYSATEELDVAVFRRLHTATDARTFALWFLYVRLVQCTGRKLFQFAHLRRSS